MKKNFLFLLSLSLISIAVFAQNPCVKGDCIDGEGTFLMATGDRYVGEFRGGKFSGEGEYFFAGEDFKKGNKYVGEFRNGLFNGHGTFYFITEGPQKGDKFEGELRDGKFNGPGVYEFANGDKYIGEFKDSKFEGQGSLIYSNADRYVGEFKNGLRHGHATLYYADGSKFIGMYEEGKCHGQGTYYFESGDTYVGMFIDGKIKGQGVMYFKSGDRYIGEFKDAQFDGLGILYQEDGKIKSGNWGAGVFISASNLAIPPVISWISPALIAVIVNEPIYALKACVMSHEKTINIKIFVNEVLQMQIPVTKSFTEKTPITDCDISIDKPVFLVEGNNEVKIVAEYSNGKVQSEIRHVTFGHTVLTTQTNPKINSVTLRNDYALLFATDDYTEWNNLANPIKDAETIAAELEKTYGFHVEIVKNPSNEQIMSKLKEYARKTYQKQDQLLVFFSGHGQYDEEFKEGYVVAKNSSKIDESRVSYISHGTLRTVINNIACNHTLLVMDVCFGGTFDPIIASVQYRGAVDDIYKEISQTDYVNRKLKYITRKYLTSGAKEYVPDGRPGEHSPFVRKFLDALRNYGGEDKILTLEEISTYVERVNPQPRLGEFGANEPGSDFLFIVK
jgi:hypothetical protein